MVNYDKCREIKRTFGIIQLFCAGKYRFSGGQETATESCYWVTQIMIGISDSKKFPNTMKTPKITAKGPTNITRPKSASCLVSIGIPDVPQQIKPNENKILLIMLEGLGATNNIRIIQLNPAQKEIANKVRVLSL
jgi:hypothetical protein